MWRAALFGTLLVLGVSPCIGSVAHICQDQLYTLQCPAGEKIAIKSAQFGRAELELCPLSTSEERDIRFHCAELNIEVLGASCDGKESCVVSADHVSLKATKAAASRQGLLHPEEQFVPSDEYCPSVHKYLTVAFECQPMFSMAVQCSKLTTKPALQFPASTAMECSSLCKAKGGNGEFCRKGSLCVCGAHSHPLTPIAAHGCNKKCSDELACGGDQDQYTCYLHPRVSTIDAATHEELLSQEFRRVMEIEQIPVPKPGRPPQNRDCVVESRCTECTVSCGSGGTFTCYSTIVQTPLGTGLPCPAKLVEVKNCPNQPPCGVCRGMPQLPPQGLRQMCPGNTTGTICKVTCNPNYVASPARCGEDDTWSSGTCTQMTSVCGVPALDNFNGYIDGCTLNKCTLRCHRCYTPSAPAPTATCDTAQQAWVITGSCMPVQCPVPSPPFIPVRNPLDPCDPMAPAGRQCVCGINYPSSQCKAIKCDTNSLSGAVDPTVFSTKAAPGTLVEVGSNVALYCKIDPSLFVGLAICTRTRASTGAWQANVSPDRCERLDNYCPAHPAVGNGTLAGDCSSISIGGVCAITCLSGFTKTMDSKCNVAGKWDLGACAPTTGGACIPSQLYPLVNATYSCNSIPEGDGDLAKYLQQCKPKCNAGLVPQLDQEDYNSNWRCKGGKIVMKDGSALPAGDKPWDLVCVPAKCTAPPTTTVTGGKWNCKAGEATCTPTCDKGFEYNGAVVLRCDGGVWTSSSAVTSFTCTASQKCTTRPPSIGNADVTCMSGPDSFVSCTMFCLPGFTQVGNLTCNAGQWSTVQCVGKQCVSPPVLPNFPDLHFPDCNNTAEGGVCRAACRNGQAMQGASMEWKCTGGNWTMFSSMNVSHSCNAVCTGLPPPIPNGKYPTTCQGKTLCVANCSIGYAGSGNATCVNGAWSGFTQCAARDCEARPQRYRGAEFICQMRNTTGKDSTCIVDCPNGYYASPRTITCSNGVWGAYSCMEQRCYFPPVVADGTFDASCKNASHGTRCQATCLGGKPANGGPAICVLGNWTNIPACGVARCFDPPAQIPHGRWLWSGPVDEGKYIQLQCLDGYAIADPTGMAQCARGNTYTINSRNARCLPAPCVAAPKNPSNGAFTAGCERTASGGQCNLTCDATSGYVKTGDAKCVEGKWSEVNCIKKVTPGSCSGPPAGIVVRGRYTNCAIVKQGEACEVTCDAGYKAGQQAVCDPRGNSTFISSATCVPQTCNTDPLPIFNGRFSPTCKTNETNGTTNDCVPTCFSEQFQAHGAAKCKGGQWDTTTAQCLPAPCKSPPEVPSGAIPRSCHGGVPDGFTCPVTCRLNTTLKGQLVCQRGAWTSVECIKDGCYGIAVVNNGMLLGLNCQKPPFADGLECAIRCSAGHYLSVANANAKCINSSWIYNANVCTPKRCGPPPAPLDGSFPDTCNGTLIGGMCAPKCKLGYSALLPAICVEDPTDPQKGKWNVQNCVQGKCPRSAIPTVQFGNVNCGAAADTYASGVICNVTCNTGFVLKGEVRCSMGKFTEATCEQKRCIAKAEAPNAVISGGTCIDAPAGATCLFACKPGYSLQHAGHSAATCVYGNWTELPICVAATCRTLPPTISNGRWDPFDAALGAATLAYSCAPGFKKINAMNATCVNGKWTVGTFIDVDAVNINKVIGCKLSGCSNSPDSVVNGVLAACSNASVGDKCALTCTVGAKTGDAVCEGDNIWSKPRCVIPTATSCKGPPVPVTIPHGKIDSTCAVVPNAHACPVTCVAGYDKSGDLMCINGTWGPTPRCVERPCNAAPSAVIPNGFIPKSCSNGTNGTTCVPHCNAGYTAEGSLVCHQGIWTNNGASCQPKMCDRPDAGWPQPNITGYCANTSIAKFPHNTQCALPCPAGMEGRATLTCTNGDWVLVRCQPRRCSSQEIFPHGKFATTCGPHTCNFNCNPGYQFPQAVIIATCDTLNGSWVFNTTCQEPPCTIPNRPLQNGKWNCSAAPIRSCSPACESGFVSSGSLTCQKGEWSSNLASCDPIGCPMSQAVVAKGSVQCTLKDKNATFAPNGIACSVLCDKGYRVRGDLTCNLNKWSTVVCERRVCASLPVVVNGMADAACAGRDENSTCKVKCNPGYEPDPSSPMPDAALCSNGTWVNIAKCIPLSCKDFLVIEHGRLQMVNTSTAVTAVTAARNGTELGYVCDSGYVKNDNSTRVCSYGKWIQRANATMGCTEAPCSPPKSGPSPIANGQVSATCLNVASGKNCPVTCDKGFVASGPAVCLRGVFRWPICIKNDTGVKLCSSPPTNVTNGRFLCTTAAEGQPCALLCDRGYNKTGDAVCQGGSFKVSGHCQPLGCPSMPKGVSIGLKQYQDCVNTPHLGKCNFTCPPGYKGSGPAVCRLGLWDEGSATCTPKDCPKGGVFKLVSSLKNGTVNCDCDANATFCSMFAESGFKCKMTCDAGFTQLGDFMCDKGSWTTASCIQSGCTKLPVTPFGSFNPLCVPTKGDNGQCPVKCNPGYEPSIPFLSTAVCSRGNWTAIPKCQPKKCANMPLASIPNSLGWKCNKTTLNLPFLPIISILPFSPSGYDDCYPMCPPNFKAVGKAVCDKGEFVGATAVRCDPLNCGVPTGTIANGQIDVAKCTDRPVGAKCDIKCNPGFVIGVEMYCVTGGWTTGSCVNASVPLDQYCTNDQPLKTENGRFEDCKRVPVGGICPLHCNPGYHSIGGNLTCYGPKPTFRPSSGGPRVGCESNNCNVTYLKTIANWTCESSNGSEFSGSSMATGGKCYRICRADQVREGVAECRRGGTWSGAFTSRCMGIPCKTLPPVAPLTPGASWNPKCRDTPNGGVCDIIGCPNGTSTRTNMTCRAGNWSGSAHCSYPRCFGSGPLQNAYFSARCHFNAGENDKCLVHCNAGFSSSVGATYNATCVHGKWQHNHSCAASGCTGQPNMVLGAMRWLCNGTAQNSTCKLICGGNTRLQGQGIARCDRGKWVRDTSACLARSCPAPPAAVTGGFHVNASACANVISFQTCKVNCTGTTAVKQRDSLCNANGTWTLGSCTTAANISNNDCVGTPTQRVSKGTWQSCIRTAPNSQCLLICDRGYQKTGDATCVNRIFDTSKASCVPRDCVGGPPTPREGSFAAPCNSASQTFKHGQMCNATCDVPLSISIFPSPAPKPSYAICSEGVWNTDNLACNHVPCPQAPKTANGFFAGCANVSTPHKTECMVACAVGYKATAPSARCLDGVWDTPKCLPMGCQQSPSSPIGGQYEPCNAIEGQICSLKCGNTSVKTGDAICVNGTWIGTQADKLLPVCKEQPCLNPPPAVIENGEWNCNGSTASGDYCPLYCKFNTIPTGRAVCKGGKWTLTTQRCIQPSCKTAPSNLANGNFTGRCTDVPAGGRCFLKCKDGYKASGEALCLKGKWTPVRCDPIGCKRGPLIKNGFSFHSVPNDDGTVGQVGCENITHSKTCKVGCDPGYSLNTTRRETRCMLGVWVNVPSCGSLKCNPPQNYSDVTRALFYHCPVGPDGLVDDGGVCHPQCAGGRMKPVGDAVCKKGIWQNTARCDGLPCSDHPEISHGSFDAKSCTNLPIGGECAFQCDQGYTKNRNSVCTVRGWDRGMCIVKNVSTDCTSRPTTIANGRYFPCLEIKDGNQCPVTCDRGFKVIANATCHKGVFTPGLCGPISCVAGPMAVISWGQLAPNCSNAAHGQQCPLTCNARGAVPAANATCLNGKWDLTNVRCVSVCPSIPAVPHGQARNCAPNTPFAKSCEVQCNPPYVKKSDIICRGTFWEGLTTACGAPNCVTAPHNPVNGKYGAECVNAREQSVCMLHCDTGFRKSDDAICVRGQWRSRSPDANATMPRCLGKSCVGPPANTVSGGTWGCAMGEDGMKCRLVCKTGFYATGNAVCSGGLWTQTNQRCESASCPKPPIAPRYGHFEATCANTASGGRCLLKCDAGYAPTSEALCSDGTWNEVSCVAKGCTTAPVVANGVAGRGCGGNGTTCMIVCKDGYELLKNEGIAKCTAGQWSFVPQCVPASCKSRPPTPVGGFFRCGNARHGETCALECGKGYKASSNAICQYGKWVGNSVCESIGCSGAPFIEKNVTIDTRTCINKKDGETCTVTCVNASQVKTQDFVCRNGNWSKSVRCVTKRANSGACTTRPFPNPSEGEYDPCFYIENNHTCGVHCRNGYRATPARCINGTYKLGSCRPRHCRRPPPIPVNGRYINNCTNMSSGQICNLSCIPGFTKLGDAVCSRGRWNITRAQCSHAPCTSAPISTLGLVVNCTGVKRLGESCDFKCNGETTTTKAVCLGGSNWRYACTGMKCVSPPRSPQNGKYEPLCSNVDPKGVCKLTCNAGFSKSSDAVCVGGTWRSVGAQAFPPPRCVAKGCKRAPLATVKDGTWACQGADGNRGRCPLNCARGLIPSGFAICIGEHWERVNQSCLHSGCMIKPQNPANGEYTGNCTQRPSGSTCSLRCKPGFFPTSDSSCHDGKWSIEACEQAPCVEPPSVLNGYTEASCRRVRDGGSCRVYCRHGFEVNTTDNRAQCKASKWISVPGCRNASCTRPPPLPANALSWGCAAAADSAGCPLVCKAGFQPIGDARCKMGRWVSEASCVSTNCRVAPANPANGTYALDCANAPPGKVCTLTCSRGSIKSQDAVCVGGVWNVGVCRHEKPNDCTVPSSILHGRIEICERVADGGQCLVTCNTGYEKTGNAVCDKGFWRMPQCLKLNCTAPPVAPPRGFFKADCTNQSTCALSCELGFIASGQAVCRNGQWDTNNVTCNGSPCNVAPTLANGQASCNLPVANTQTCPITCNPGYYTNSPVATCLMGVWSLPRCQEGCTEGPEAPLHGSFAANCGNAQDKQTCVLTCEPGYAKTGDAMCMAGKWMDSDHKNTVFPTCRASACRNSPIVITANGTRLDMSKCIGTAPGSTCVISCPAGEVKTRDPVCNGGIWTSESCVQQDRCMNIRCAFPAGAECTQSVKCVNGKCEYTFKAAGTNCSTGACSGDGICVAPAPDRCLEVECPYPRSPCVSNGVCDPKVGECYFPPKEDGLTCDDRNANTYNDRCVKGRCVGIPNSDNGLPYPVAQGAPIGYWGYQCCMIFTNVVDGRDVSIIELYSDQYVGNISAYHLEVKSASTDGTLGTKNYILKSSEPTVAKGSFVIITNNKKAYLDFAKGRAARNIIEIPELGILTGKEVLRLHVSPLRSDTRYLIDAFPPINATQFYNWQDGYATLNVHKGWSAIPHAFANASDATAANKVPLGTFDIFSLFLKGAKCVCQPGNADAVDTSGPLCYSATLASPLSSYTPIPFNPDDDFGGQWLFVAPGVIDGMDHKWLCTLL